MDSSAWQKDGSTEEKTEGSNQTEKNNKSVQLTIAADFNVGADKQVRRQPRPSCAAGGPWFSRVIAIFIN